MAVCRLWLCDMAVCRLRLCDDYVYVTIMSVWHVKNERRNKRATGPMWETYGGGMPNHIYEIGSTRICPQPRWFILFIRICCYYFTLLLIWIMLEIPYVLITWFTRFQLIYELISLNYQVLALYLKSNWVLKLDLKLMRKELQGGFSYDWFYTLKVTNFEMV